MNQRYFTELEQVETGLHELKTALQFMQIATDEMSESGVIQGYMPSMMAILRLKVEDVEYRMDELADLVARDIMLKAL